MSERRDAEVRREREENKVEMKQTRNTRKCEWIPQEVESREKVDVVKYGEAGEGGMEEEVNDNEAERWVRGRGRVSETGRRGKGKIRKRRDETKMSREGKGENPKTRSKFIVPSNSSGV